MPAHKGGSCGPLNPCLPRVFLCMISTGDKVLTAHLFSVFGFCEVVKPGVYTDGAGLGSIMEFTTFSTGPSELSSLPSVACRRVCSAWLAYLWEKVLFGHFSFLAQ